MEQTPFEYLQACRIEKSIPEVLEKAESITKIAVKYGFTGSSYYAETFRKEMGCTPGEYRKWYFGEIEENPVQTLRKESPKPAKKAAESAPAPEAEHPAERTSEVRKKAEKPVSTRRSSMPAHLL